MTYSYKMVGNLAKVMAKNPEVMAKAWRNADAFMELFVCQTRNRTNCAFLPTRPIG